MFGKSKVAVLKMPKAPPAGQSAPASAPGTPAATVVNAPAPAAAPAPPDRNDEFSELKSRVHKQLVEMLDLAALSKRSGDDVREEVKQVITGLCDQQDALLNFNDRQRLVTEILDETFGLGPLETLLKDALISDILINGPKQVYVERKGRLQLTNVVFKDNAHL